MELSIITNSLFSHLSPRFSKAVIQDKNSFLQNTFAFTQSSKHLEIFLLCETYLLHLWGMGGNGPLYHEQHCCFFFPECNQQQFHCGLH